MKNHSELNILSVTLYYSNADSYWRGTTTFGEVQLCGEILQFIFPSATPDKTLYFTVTNKPATGYIPVKLICKPGCFIRWEIPDYGLIDDGTCQFIFGMNEQVLIKILSRMKRKRMYNLPRHFTLWINAVAA